ncbi:sucrase ferredoxin [Cumulibacter soli]|uniref:sucrase ferredoxin n=1 Tax=Cumulibacter soli TaxID=2546344 RepID=UPI0010674E6B|nr:sucrase ferredoxin [Cumulibacter soli]
MSQVEAAQRCSVRSLMSGEPMAGSAGSTEVGYLLVEEPGAWPHKALGPSTLGGIGPALESAAAHVGLKTLVFRQPGRRERAPLQRRVFVATLARQHRAVVTFTVRNLAEVLDSDLAAAAHQPLAVHPDAESVTEQLLFVCAHAKRDQCCAIYGVPIAGALAARYPQRVYECSHLGGHRFAATALALPSGAVYGRLTEESAERAYDAERHAKVIAEDLRGLSSLPAAAQMVDAELRLRLGLTGIDDVRMLSYQQINEGHVIRMTVAGSVWQGLVESRKTVAKPPSCGKPADRSTAYAITKLARER